MEGGEGWASLAGAICFGAHATQPVYTCGGAGWEWKMRVNKFAPNGPMPRVPRSHDRCHENGSWCVRQESLVCNGTDNIVVGVVQERAGLLNSVATGNGRMHFPFWVGTPIGDRLVKNNIETEHITCGEMH